jgi:hypothetical protein
MLIAVRGAARKKSIQRPSLASIVTTRQIPTGDLTLGYGAESDRVMSDATLRRYECAEPSSAKIGGTGLSSWSALAEIWSHRQRGCGMRKSDCALAVRRYAPKSARGICRTPSPLSARQPSGSPRSLTSCLNGRSRLVHPADVPLSPAPLAHARADFGVLASFRNASAQLTVTATMVCSRWSASPRCEVTCGFS